MDQSSVLLVEALHQFKGKNNDELCFKKGSIITVTQSDDETWWEGTLDGNTGWFPANYVRPYKSTGASDSSSSAVPPVATVSPSSEQQMYRALVLRNLLDSERQHISDLNLLINSCLKPLANNKLLCANEYNTLVRNLERVVSVHEQLLSRLEAEGEKPSAEQRVGGVFLTMAGDILSQSHQQYCSHHPRAVLYLQEHKDEVNRCVESTSLCADDNAADGAALSGNSSPQRRRPGLLVLTTGLSRPFRRLQQYPSLLQEMHRLLPEAHRDRGDAQRAAKVMADMAASCSALRRQKELQLEVVSGQVVGWDRGTLAVLGEVQTMGSVAVLPDHTDRYLVVFPNHLVILSVSLRMSNFIFQSQHNLSDISCCQLEDCDQYKNAFEITGGKIDRLVAVCQSKGDQQRWVDNLSQHSDSRNGGVGRPSGGGVAVTPPALPTKTAAASGGNAKNLPVSSSKLSGGQPTGVKGQPPLPPHKQQPPPLLPSTPKGAVSVAGPPPPAPSHGTVNSRQSASSSRVSAVPHKSWSLCDLRPSPPLRPNQLKRARNIKKDERWHDEDSVILRVVEAYCASTAARHTHASCLGGAVDALSPFGELRGPRGQAPHNWCCGLAISAIRRTVDLD